jgi:uncharacterized coiled-coil protein SlyX
MAKIDWDWFAELAICETKIIELEVRVASQKQNIELILALLNLEWVKRRVG